MHRGEFLHNRTMSELCGTWLSVGEKQVRRGMRPCGAVSGPGLPHVLCRSHDTFAGGRNNHVLILTGARSVLVVVPGRYSKHVKSLNRFTADLDMVLSSVKRAVGRLNALPACRQTSAGRWSGRQGATQR